MKQSELVGISYTHLAVN